MKSLRSFLITHLLLNACIAQGMENPTPESSSPLNNAIELAIKRSKKHREEKEKELKMSREQKNFLRLQDSKKLDEFSRQQDILIELLKQQKLQKQESLSNSSGALQAQVATFTPPPEMQPAQQAPIVNGRKKMSLDEYIKMMEKNCLDDDEEQAIKVVVPGSNGDDYDDIAQMLDDVKKSDDDE